MWLGWVTFWQSKNLITKKERNKLSIYQIKEHNYVYGEINAVYSIQYMLSVVNVVFGAGFECKMKQPGSMTLLSAQV